MCLLLPQYLLLVQFHQVSICCLETVKTLIVWKIFFSSSLQEWLFGIFFVFFVHGVMFSCFNSFCFPGLVKKFMVKYSIKNDTIMVNFFFCDSVINFYNTISLSRHEQVCLMRLRFKRYFSLFSHDGRSISQNVASLNILVHDMINLLYHKHWTGKRKCSYDY